MENYENLIIASCQGETPKQKYEWLIDQLTKLSVSKSFVSALKDTWDEASIKNIRNFIDSTHETLYKK